jgi:hypothetical protein
MMAVYRQIQITYWQDKFVLKLTPEEKFFYIYLLTNSKTKQCGIYELPIQIICVETGYNQETVIKLIQKFIEYKKIAYDWENEEVFLLNWVKHNPFEGNKNIKLCVQKELQQVHNPSMIPLDSPLQALTKPLHNKNKNKNKNKNNNKEKVSVDYFENLFTLYLPEFVNKLPLETWKEWINYRREIKKKLTKSIADKQLKFLILQDDPAGCINESIKNGWAGLFELKGKPKEEKKSSTLGQGEQDYKKVLEEANKQPKWRPK